MLKATFWHLNDSHWMFLCKIIIQKRKINAHKIELENNKMAAMMEISAAILEL